MTRSGEARWIRLYRPGPLRVLALALAAFGCVALAMAGSVVVAASSKLGERVVLILVVALVVGFGMWLTGRLSSSGVWVRASGLRLVTPRRTTAASWQAVTLERRSAPFDAVWCLSGDGPAWRTPINVRSLDFLGRGEAYDIAVTAVMDWYGLHHPGSGGRKSE